MKALRLYRIEDKYIGYISSRDCKVQHNKNNRRPYVGVVLTVSTYKYFVPLESPKPNHKNIKNGKHIIKLDDGKLGIMGFNNMIPVPDTALIEFDINTESDLKYAELLRRQVTLINKHKADVLDHASKTYYTVVRNPNGFLGRISCNFKKLEIACDKYNPNHS